MEEKRDQSLTIRFEGTEEEVQKAMEEVITMVEKIAPEARLQIIKVKNK